MHINKNILFDRIKNFLQNKKEKVTVDYDFLLSLIHQVIFHDSTQNCIIK
jgi:hypothetical protein